jgi:hypothetical protein
MSFQGYDSWWDWGLTQSFVFTKQVLYGLIHTSSPFCSIYFADGSLKNYLSWLASNHNLPTILTSQVVRILGMSHQCLAQEED